MYNAQAHSNPLTFFSACEQTRSLWKQLNELRGRSSTGTWVDCDFSSFATSLAELRDSIAMRFAVEWGGAGTLRKAVLNQSLCNQQASLFLDEQVAIYRFISELAEDVESLQCTMDVSPTAVRDAFDRFKMFDTLFISHESRKSSALQS